MKNTVVRPVPYHLEIHANGFCYEPKCECHTHDDAHTLVEEWYTQGLISENEKKLIFAGKTLAGKTI